MRFTGRNSAFLGHLVRGFQFFSFVFFKESYGLAPFFWEAAAAKRGIGPKKGGQPLVFLQKKGTKIKFPKRPDLLCGTGVRLIIDGQNGNFTWKIQRSEKIKKTDFNRVLGRKNKFF